MDSIDLYCERTGPGLWAEPLNAVTNVAFIVAALFLWRFAWNSRRLDIQVRVLLCLMVSLGVGSGLFHTIPNSLTIVLDELPIAFTVLHIAWLYCRRIIGLSAIVSGGILAAAMFGAYTGMQIPYVLNGSLMYVTVLILVASLGMVHRLQDRREPYSFLAAAGVFVVALFFRTIDNATCSVFPLGTHFMWHILDAIALYLATLALLVNLPADSNNSRSAA